MIRWWLTPSAYQHFPHQLEFARAWLIWNTFNGLGARFRISKILAARVTRLSLIGLPILDYLGFF